MRRGAFTALLVGALALALFFLALPLIAIFAEAGPAAIVRQLGSASARDAIVVSLETNLIAQAVILAVGTPAAYLLATRRFRGRTLALTLLELPLVLPPAVAGVGLLAAFGSQGLLGGSLDVLGLRLPFTQTAVVLAVIFVASPFYLRQAVAAFEAVDPDLLAAARTLGARPARAFGRIALPLALGGLGAGATLAFARGLGEFGATIIFAGSFPGRTQTLPLAIYAEFDRDFTTALAIGALLVAVSAAILLTTRLVTRWSPFGSTWTSPSATSGSASPSR
ncbi:MAG: molybdate transport system permease protein [Miltoncostaeaceae bacterium]|jgi:molybdate transport system permease protein|nr:molybdate transport system permease protein [Miltoncostaeaceae bacterium]